MGSRGITSHESDFGLDLLAVAGDRYPRSVEYRTFHIKHIAEPSRTHIVDEFIKEGQGWEPEYIDYFYSYTFPYRLAKAVTLAAECFAEHRQTGKYNVYDHTTESERWINEFIYTSEDLEALCTELQSTLVPKHPLYDSWEESDSFSEWQAHIQMLCDTLSEAITEKAGGGNG